MSDQYPDRFGYLGPDPDSYWDKKLSPDPHWNQCGSTTLLQRNNRCLVTTSLMASGFASLCHIQIRRSSVSEAYPDPGSGSSTLPCTTDRFYTRANFWNFWNLKKTVLLCFILIWFSVIYRTIVVPAMLIIGSNKTVDSKFCNNDWKGLRYRREKVGFLSILGAAGFCAITNELS